MRLSTLLLIASLTGFAAEHRRPRMPLLFLPNHGQASPEAQFMVKGVGITALFERHEIVYTAHGGSVRVRFTGASGPTAVEGVNRIAGEVNFLSGLEDEWKRAVPVYSGVAYREVYPGIDLKFSEAGRHLKSEFLVAPGADPARIGLEFTGADHVWVRDDGSLAVRFGRRLVHEDPPLIYQFRNGERLHVDGSFVVTGNVVSFSIGAYDRTLPLVIDPVVYTTLLSGSGTDAALSLAVDSTGAAYIAGFTSSFDLATINPAQSSNAGGNEVFVAKLNPAGNALVYCTFIGGRGDDRAAAIAVDSTGAAYVAGATTSSNFPTRAALQPTFRGVKDAFVLKLNGAGNALVYSTYLGGTASDSAQGIALDSAGNAYVAGDTASSGFPATGYQTTLRGGVDAFVAKLSANGSQLVYSTFLGGSADEHAAAVAVDASGQAVVAGSTYSGDYPTVSAHQGATAGGQDVFLTKLAASGAALVFSTYFGGSAGYVGSAEEARCIALDSPGNVYIAGQTSSLNFPVRNAAQANNAGWQDAFAAKFTSGGTLVYSTFVGGPNVDIADTLAVDSAGSAHIGGATTSANLMSLLGAQGQATGLYDGFIVKLTPAGNAASALVLLGGAGSDNVAALAVDTAGNVYAAGYTLSPTFPLPNGTVAVNAGNYGAFLTKMVLSGTGVAVTVSPLSATLNAGQTQQFTATVMNTANPAVTWSVTPAVGTISGTGLYTAPATVASATTVTVKATSVADPTKSASATVTLSTQTNLAPAGAASQSSLYAVGTGPSNAIDGNTDGNYFHGSINCTNDDPFAWWQVDLGASSSIGSVVLWNRTDGSMSRLSDYWVFISDTPFTASDTPATLQNKAGVWSSRQTSAPNPSAIIPVNASGRYVRVQLNSRNYLHMAEVQVFGARIVSVQIAPSSLMLTAGQTQQFTATVANAVSTAVTWSVSPALGTIDSSGLYTAPASLTSMQTVAVTATSVADSSKSATATIALSTQTNLALAGAASQSSLYAIGTGPSNAIDGNTDGNYFHGSINCTNDDPFAWWQVDLGASSSIGSIVLWNRTDGSMSRLSDYWVFISDTPFTVSDTPATLQNRAGVWSSRQTSAPNPSAIIPANASGRYVRIQLNSRNYLHMAEVQVFGARIVQIAPSSLLVTAGQSQQFTATVANAASTAVTWSVSPALGTISAAGLYTAPATVASAQTVTVTATSIAEPSRSASATVTLSTQTNLALAGVASQSSVYDTFTGPSNAIDGNTDGDYFRRSVNCTNGDPFAWWQVDLGASSSISSIIIWNRTDGSMSRLSDYWVFISDTPFTASDTPATLQNRAGVWSSRQMSEPNPKATIAVNGHGRYVRIQLNTANFLHMAEVQIIGAPR